MSDQYINDLFNELEKRKKICRTQSYTSFLINNQELLAKKIGEESSELIIDFIKKNKSGIVNESADLLYHLIVVWISVGIKPQDVWDELSRRKANSGLEEKSNRSSKNE